MNKSLAPLIVAFAVIILLTFIVVNSRPGYVEEQDSTNLSEKNFLSLPKRKTSGKIQDNSTRKVQSASFSPDITALVEEAKKRLGEHDNNGAEDLLRTVIIFDPENSTALSLLGRIFFYSKRYDLAEEMLAKLLSMEPENETVMNQLGSVLAKKGKFEDAIKKCMKAVELHPDYAEAHINLSAIFSASGDNENSIKHFMAAYKLIGYGVLSYSVDPVFDKVRVFPEFQEIVDKAKKDWNVHKRGENGKNPGKETTNEPN